MDVRVFQTFLEVANCRHFGKAAENLYLTQSAVSARVKQLEDYFGTSLFTRNRNNIQLTSSGERLQKYAEAIVNNLQQAKADLSLNDKSAIQISIAGTPNIWDAYLQHCLSIITESFDGFSFRAESLSREQITRQLLEQSLDIGVVFELLKSDDLEYKELTKLKLILVATKPVNVNEALNHRYVYVDWGTKFASEHAAAHPEIPPPYLRTTSGRIALDFILEKGGAAYLPESLVLPFLESNQLFPIEGIPPLSRSVFITYRRLAARQNNISKIATMLSDTSPTSGYVISSVAENR